MDSGSIRPSSACRRSSSTNCSNAVCDVDDPEDKDVRHFLNALKAAIDWELPVHVSLSPLGHTDLGWYTIFPHCHTVQGQRPGRPLEGKLPDNAHTCRACDHTFVPNEHHSSERDDVELDAQSLEKQLGETGYEQSSRTFDPPWMFIGASHRILDNKKQRSFTSPHC